MTSPVDRWKLGLFVVLGLLLIVLGLTWFGMARLQRPTHAAYAYFDEPLVGLEPGSSVKFRGVPIGVVDSIKLASDKKHLQVLAALYDDRLVDLGLDPSQMGPECEFPPELRAQLVTSFLTQTSFVLVDFYQGGPGSDRPLPFATPINTIRTVRSTFRSVEEGLREVLRELPDVAHSAQQLLDEARADLRAADVPALSRRVDKALEAAEQRVRDLEQLPVMRSATAAFQEVELLAHAWRDEDGPVRSLLKELQAVAQELRTAVAAADVTAASRSLQAAGDDAAELARDMRGELPHLRSALAAIERFAGLLERDPGALLHGRAPVRSPLQKE